MKRQFTSLRKTENWVREYVYMLGRYKHPDNARKIDTFKSNVAFENWFKMVLKFDI